ncbi:WD40 repeat domain-containing protein [Reinekea sp.]|jgi:hypothetical protein|uniref:WD40 repeat domain-containing protein n=1 Tax=Reinekea sp. TaxID=1970455 RepID=UPI00398995AD
MYRLKVLIRPLLMATALFGLLACGGSGNEDSSSASNDATLAQLTFSAGMISPEFAPDTTDYTVITGKAFSTLTATPTQANATVTINETPSSGPASSPIELDAGETEVTVTVTAPDGTSSQVYTVILARVISLELLDPTPGANDKFGYQVVILGNGNIVVSDSQDSSRFANNGAVHLYSPLSSTPIGSVYGDAGGDQLGSTRITALPNSHYVVTSAIDNENGVVDVGSVRLVDGRSGMQIGSTLAGHVAYDYLGSSSITALSNNYYVVASADEDVNGIANAGSVRLMNGNTGIQIGSIIAGNTTNDSLGFDSVTELPNGNYVIASAYDDENGIVDAGSVRLVDGLTGEQIGSMLTGDALADRLGGSSITALPNGHYVIASRRDDENGVVDAGSVRLVNGSTGEQIGNALVGNVEGDAIGASGVTALPNSNYVVASSSDDENGVVNAGSVRLFDGSTGEQIGNAISGDVENDYLGASGVTALPNGNYVVASRYDDENGVVDAGSVRLVNGSTGIQIGSTLAGDTEDDYLGFSDIIALPNNHYVIASAYEDENGIVNAGTVRLVDGNTGLQIGSALAGDVTDDRFGFGGVTLLSNGHYVIASTEYDDENGITDAGSVRLVDGDSGLQIGSTLAGDDDFDNLGFSGITALPNGNYVIASAVDSHNGISSAGSVLLVDGNTGAQLGNAITGTFVSDMRNVHITHPEHDAYYIVAQPFADKSGQVDAGMVRMVVP